MKTKTKSSTEPRKVVIHNRRFWWRYDSGRMERIYANERIKSHLAQANRIQKAEQEDE